MLSEYSGNSVANPVMPPPLRFSSRWVPWKIALVVAAILSPFIGTALYCLLTPEPWPEAARIAIPIAVPALYLVLLVAFNKRYVTVTPDGVRVSSGPFPGGIRQTIRRDQIAHCYLRLIVDSVDGHELDRYFLAGVELKGSMIQDVSGRIDTEMEAREAAYQIRGILNAHPSASALHLAPVSTLSALRSWRILVVIWFVVFLIAILAGGIWENDHTTWRPPVRRS